MRVLVVSSKYPPEYAGSGLRAHNTYKRLARKFGVKFDVITGGVTSNYSRRYVIEGVPVKVISNKNPKEFEQVVANTKLTRLVKRIQGRVYQQRNYWFEALPMFAYLLQNGSKYDVIHVFGNNAVTSAAISYSKMTGKPIVVEVVNLTDDPHQYEPWPISSVWGRGFAAHTMVVCLSQYLRKVCLKYGYVDQQIWCRSNPVDERKFYFELERKKTYRSKLFDSNDSSFLILHLAKFMPRKRQLFMVEVMPYLPENYRLILVGPLVDSGPFMERDRTYFRSILDAIKLRDLEDRVQVIPEFLEHPEEFIKASDVFVLPSVGEAFGTPFLEALACGVPVVTSDIPGVFDQWIKPGVNGYICQFDSEQWAEKIQMACRMDADTLRQGSEDVLHAASTEVIDREYYTRLVSTVAGDPT